MALANSWVWQAWPWVWPRHSYPGRAADGSPFPLLVAISLFALHKAYRPSRWLWVGIGLAATTLLVLFLNTGIVQDRIAQGERDVELMTDGNFQTSLGLRILMWKIALETGLEAPLLGQGFSGYLRKVDGLLEKEDIPSDHGPFQNRAPLRLPLSLCFPRVAGPDRLRCSTHYSLHLSSGCAGKG
jgi:hypothetical protein